MTQQHDHHDPDQPAAKPVRPTDLLLTSSIGRIPDPRDATWTARTIPDSDSSTDPRRSITATSTRPCPAGCGQIQTAVPIPERGAYRWPICSCREPAVTAYEQRIADRQQRYEAIRTDAYNAVTGSTPLTAMAQRHLTGGGQLVAFRREWLHQEPDQIHPVDYVQSWVQAIQAYGPHANYHDPDSPPAALYFYNDVRGCGKTHLAVGAGLALAPTHTVVCLEDLQFVPRYWHCPPERRQGMADYPINAFLSIIDDLGRRYVRPSEAHSTGTADVWDVVFDGRHRRGGWTIITSNFLPNELYQQGTINLSTYDRLMEMLRDGMLLIDGPSRRGMLHQIDEEGDDDPSTS